MSCITPVPCCCSTPRRGRRLPLLLPRVLDRPHLCRTLPQPAAHLRRQPWWMRRSFFSGLRGASDHGEIFGSASCFLHGRVAGRAWFARVSQPLQTAGPGVRLPEVHAVINGSLKLRGESPHRSREQRECHASVTVVVPEVAGVWPVAGVVQYLAAELAGAPH
jgi:hypothetical protein